MRSRDTKKGGGEIESFLKKQPRAENAMVFYDLNTVT